MIRITSGNLLAFLHAYFASLGLEHDAAAFLTAHNFTAALVLKLPAVCLVPQNKPATSRSKQTHIHVTGSNRYFFFGPQKIADATASTPDFEQPLMVSMQNIRALHGEALTGDALEITPSSTMVKIAYRASQESQVQISKLRLDGSSFIELRNALYEDDLLIFLKYRTGNQMFALGIPRGFYAGSYTFSDDLFEGLESKGAVTVKNALSAVSEAYDDAAVVESDASIADAVYQDMVNTASPSVTTYVAEKYIPPAWAANHRKEPRPSTNPAIGKEAICDAGYCCAVDAAHPSFLKPDGSRYMEAHHLIPLGLQASFENKLDTKANLVSLCPLCHRQIHYGRPEEVAPLLARLYEARAERLKESGLSITLEQLLRFYELS